MKPAEVLFDKRLSLREKHVYDVMVYFRSGPIVESGERWLAGAAGIDRRSYRHDRDRLIEFGHLERQESDGPEGRAKYRLTADIFSAPAISREVEPSKVDFRAALVTCPKCKKACGGLLKVGWCRGCNWKVKVRDAAREVFREEADLEKLA